MGYESWFESVNLKAPAAGGILTRAIPGEVFERPVSIRFRVTTSAAVANRFPAVVFLDGDNNTIMRVESTAAVVASSSAAFTFAVGMGANNFRASGEQYAPLPDMLLPAGFKVRIDVVAIDAADQISSAFYFARRYPTSEWSPSDGATPYSPETAVII